MEPIASTSDCCATCGSAQFRVEEGFYFCNQCGTQQQSRREVEHDVSAAVRLGKKMAKSKAKKGAEAQTRERTRKLRDDPNICERALQGDDYPRWLDTIGTRLCTASKLIVKMAQILVHDFRAPPKSVDYCRLLFYTYLANAEVAFCAEEVATEGNESLFCPLVKYTLPEIRNMRGERKRAEKERERRIQKKLLESSTIWEQLSFRDEKKVKKPFDDDVDWEKAEREGYPVGAEPIDIFGRIETKLTIKAINRASIIYLGMDLLLCIVYLASQLAGCQWILLSDIFRWYREGRFQISLSQISALDFATSWARDREEGNATIREAERRFFHRSSKNSRGAYLAIQPTSESYRMLAFVTQKIAIPRSLESVDFNKVLARFVYNLNLPRQFLQNLLAIVALLPPVSLDIGQERLGNLLPVDPGLFDHLCWVCTKKGKRYYSVGYSTFMQRVFLPDHRQLPWDRRGVKPRKRMERPEEEMMEGTANGGEQQEYLYRRPNWHFVPLPLEAKAAAIVLFSLKLFFGLDGEREFQMEPKRRRQNDHQRLPAFDFGQWMTQLEQRTHCWQGTVPEVVLGKNFKMDQMERTEPDLPSIRFYRDKSGQLLGQGGMLFHQIRADPFPGCVPNTISNRVQPKIFEGLFPGQVKSNLAQDVEMHAHNDPQMEKEALFAPLQYQATCAKYSMQLAESDLNSLLVDQKRKETFFQRFYDCHLDLELARETDDEEGNANEEIGDAQNAANQIGKLFPCSNAYQRFPPTQKFKCFAAVFPRIDDRGFGHNRRIGSIPLRLQSIPISPILVHRQIKIAFHMAEHKFSSSFRVLLRHLSLSIAETDHLLYFVFLMVESMFFDRKDFKRFEQDFRRHGRTIFCTKELWLSATNPVKIRYTLELDKFGDDDGMEGPAEKAANAKLHEFRYKISRVRMYTTKKSKRNFFGQGEPPPEAMEIEMMDGEEEGSVEDEDKEEERRNQRLLQQKITFQDQQKNPAQQQIIEIDNAADDGNGGNERQQEGEEAASDSSFSISSDSDDSSIDEPAPRNARDGDADDAQENADPTEFDPSKEQLPARLISLPPAATFALCSFRHW